MGTPVEWIIAIVVYLLIGTLIVEFIDSDIRTRQEPEDLIEKIVAIIVFPLLLVAWWRSRRH